MKEFSKLMVIVCMVVVGLLTGCGRNANNDVIDIQSEVYITETVLSDSEKPTTAVESEVILTESSAPAESSAPIEQVTETVVFFDETEDVPEISTTEFVEETDETVPSETKAPIRVSNLKASTISVSCLKVTWDEIVGYDYEVTVNTNAPYSENMYFYFKEKNLLYITALRENNEYEIVVTPIVSESETAESETVIGHTEAVKVIYDFDADPEAYDQYKDSGVSYTTNFFAGERASGLTAQPSSGAIANSVEDPITGTGICRDEYGDYCAALGQYFGHQWDRYLVTFKNGQQITIKQADDKGLKWYHTVGGDDSRRNIIEFIWYGSSAPACVMYSGSWGGFNWNGMVLDHIESIQKIEYPEQNVEY